VYGGFFMAEVRAVSRIRKCFVENSRPLTLAEIKELLPDLNSNDISMALCYFFKNRYVKREKIPNKIPRKRKTVYQYTYFNEKLKKEGTDAS